MTMDGELHDSLHGTNYLTTVLRQGLNILGASTQDDALLSRDDGSGEFTVGQFFYTRYQNLSEQWSFNFSAAGQLASTALLAPEEFYLGGPTFGRAYDSGEISGENGLAASLEVRFDQALENAVVAGYQLYAFADYGAVWDFKRRWRRATRPRIRRLWNSTVLAQRSAGRARARRTSRRGSRGQRRGTRSKHLRLPDPILQSVPRRGIRLLSASVSVRARSA